MHDDFVVFRVAVPYTPDTFTAPNPSQDATMGASSLSYHIYALMGAAYEELGHGMEAARYAAVVDA